ncbi:MAG: HAMP domain-containing histidine kinase [Candidatus Kerfeldbacteria bacterium]|nr:HAMP domain-containing histidine kinase [Candidatus Kerfeldbacteria bacterium]
MNNPRRGFALFRECADLGLSYWHCPSFLFVMSGVLTIVLVTVTYVVTSFYYSAEVVLISITLVTIVLLIMIFLVYRGMIRIVGAEVQLRESNSKLSDALSRLREAERQKREYTSMLIHDLRSPLTGIRLLTEMLRDPRTVEADTRDESVAIIHQSASQMLDMVNDLLDASKLEAGKFTIDAHTGDLSAAVRDAVHAFHPLARHAGITLQESYPTGPAALSFDDRAIHHAVANLMANALKFTPHGGTVAVSISATPDTDALVLPATLMQDVRREMQGVPGLALLVYNTGAGVPREELSRLFHPYEQATTGVHAAERGTGLGLVIVKGIVEAHGGTVFVASRHGEGTVVGCVLPVSAAHP